LESIAERSPANFSLDSISSYCSVKSSRILAYSLSIAVLLGAGWLCIYGESFFSLTRRVQPEVLVVEGWIGDEGLLAAAEEFMRSDYKYVVVTGGQRDGRQSSSNYAETAARELTRSGIPEDKIVIAKTEEIERERTFKSAAAAWRALQNKGIHPEKINVLTLGPHARRSGLVYAKVFAPTTQVGVIAWVPAEYGSTPWWRSTSRTKCLLKEIVGYPFELLLNSGRISDSPG
jgi:DUF218 domain